MRLLSLIISGCVLMVPVAAAEDGADTAPVTTTGERVGSMEPVDLVFVVDSSHSIGQNKFFKQRNFMKSIVRYADIDSGRVRVGALVFSRTVEIKFHSNKYNTTAEILAAVDKITYMKDEGSTNIADALRNMSYEMFNSRNGDRDKVPNVAMVITDGLPSNIYKDRTIIEAEHARDHGIRIYAMSVGQMNKGHDELDSIVSGPPMDHIFSVKDDDDLSDLEKQIFTICKDDKPTSTTPSTTANITNSTPDNTLCSFVKYIMSNNSRLSWQDARNVCQEMGGDLAQLDLNILDKLADMATEIIKSTNFFLPPPSECVKDQFGFWVSNTTHTTQLSGTEVESLRQGTTCMQWHFRRPKKICFTKCTLKRRHICEIKTNQSCNFTKTQQGQATLHKANRTACHDLCTEDISCKSVLTFNDELCIKVINDYQAGNVTFERKTNCSSFEVNDTNHFNVPGTKIPTDHPSRNQDTQSCYIAQENQLTATPPLLYPPMFTTTATAMTMEQNTVTSTRTVCPTISATSTETPKELSAVTSTRTVYSTISATSTMATVTNTSTEYSTISATSTIAALTSPNVTTEEDVASKYIHVVDPKSTSKYRRSKTSANDDNITSRIMGYVAIAFVIVPLALLVISDTRTIYNHFRDPSTMYKDTKPKKP